MAFTYCIPSASFSSVTTTAKGKKEGEDVMVQVFTRNREKVEFNKGACKIAHLQADDIWPGSKVYFL